MDKWISPEKDKESKKEKIEKKSASKGKKPQKKEPLDIENTIKRYTLACSQSKCKYQKVIVKRILTKKDKICPKCKSPMKLK